MLSHCTQGEQGGSNELVLGSAGGCIVYTVHYTVNSIKLYTIHHGLFQASTLLGGSIILDIPGINYVLYPVHCDCLLYTIYCKLCL